MKSNHIYPISDRLVTRAIREDILKQKSCVLWMTGLSGSGKSTIAIALEKELLANGYFAVVLDGDNIRSGINSDLSFSAEDREENIRRIAEIAKLFAQSGTIVIVSFISPTREMRNHAKSIIGEADFKEVFINTPLEVCEARDVKGLYKKARKGEIKHFTGIDAPYEKPLNPFLDVKTENKSVNNTIEFIFASLNQSITN